MPRYIDATALRKEFSERPPDYYTTGYILDTIDQQPTISPDEVRGVGKWILVDEMNDEVGAHLRYIYCSVCGGFALLEGRFGKEYKSSYCPHCGARMEVSDNA